MKSKCEFSYRHYFDVLDYAGDDYYLGTVKEIPNLNNRKQFIVLRHDIDFSLNYALKMAEKEHRKNIRATYFILLRGQYYNALSSDSSSIIRKISKMGHEIGLHYDTTFFPEDGEQALSMINKEKGLLEEIIDSQITSVAQHNPSISQKSNLILENHGFVDAGNTQKLPQIKYISDSVQNWRSGCMCKHVGREKKIQILTHPIWWHTKALPRTRIMKEFEKNELSKIKGQIKSNAALYNSYFRKLKSEGFN